MFKEEVRSPKKPMPSQRSTFAVSHSVKRPTVVKTEPLDTIQDKYGGMVGEPMEETEGCGAEEDVEGMDKKRLKIITLSPLTVQVQN